MGLTKQSNGWFLSCIFAIPLRSILWQKCNLKTPVYRGVMWGKKYKTQSFGKYEKAKAIMLKGRSFGFSGSETMCHGV